MLNFIVNSYNLYERNLYKSFLCNRGALSEEEKSDRLKAAIFTQVNKLFLQSLYLNYIEVPITTKCSLRCKECSNLIQYYENGRFIGYKKILNDINKLCQVTERIEMLRILGGEPLLHPQLKEIVTGLLKNVNIRDIQIVTNGTMLFKEEILAALRNKRVSVDISYYGNVSRNCGNLVKQLKEHGIRFYVNKDLKWTEQSDFTYHDRTKKESENVLKSCKLDCISILDGEFHLCPRSSNGADLKIFEAKEDYVNIRNYRSKRQLRKKLFYLLNKKRIKACNYCEVYMQDKLKECTPGEQISKDQALERYHAIMCVNGGKKREVDCLGSGKGFCQK